MFLGDLRDRPQPLGRGGVEPAFALHGLKQDRRRGIEPAGGIRQPLVEQLGGVDLGAEIAVVGLVTDMVQRYARAAALASIAGAGERAQGHPVEAVGEGDYQLAAGDLAGELDRRLDRVGAGRAGEHRPVIEPARLEDHVLERFEELGLGLRVQVEPVSDPVAGDVVEQRLLQDRVVVPVVERGAAGQEIEVAAAVVVMEPHALGAIELPRHRDAVAAYG